MSFFQASSVEDAVKAKMNAPASAFIAGGQSLVPRLRRSGHSFSSFIDLSRIEALLGMRTEGEWLDLVVRFSEDSVVVQVMLERVTPD